jgi:hypothetical protein
MAELKWERLRDFYMWIDNHAGVNGTDRAKVPGGWLVSSGSGLTFVPDPNHEWK